MKAATIKKSKLHTIIELVQYKVNSVAGKSATKNLTGNMPYPHSMKGKNHL